MPVESGTSIASLDSLWPLSGDVTQDGDNHLRLIKAVLKATFPGVGGTGFNTPIVATEAELNYVAGVTSNIQAQIDAISAVSGIEIPSGTIMLFYQAAAPVGWTQIANDNDSMLRMVSGTGGGVGGVDSPITLDYSHDHTTGDHALTIAEMPAHTHTIENGGSLNSDITNGGVAGTADINLGSGTNETNSEGGTGVHNHGVTGMAGSTFSPKYVDVIQASKD